MEKKQGQEMVVVNHAPKRGPRIGAHNTPRVQTDIAAPRFAGGKVSNMTAWETGCRAPPPAPWIIRATIRKPRLVASPQSSEASVKIVIQVIRKRLRPKRRESQLLVGKITALETR